VARTLTLGVIVVVAALAATAAGASGATGATSARPGEPVALGSGERSPHVPPATAAPDKDEGATPRIAPHAPVPQATTAARGARRSETRRQAPRPWRAGGRDRHSLLCTYRL
jgi:hypothetical protein